GSGAGAGGTASGDTGFAPVAVFVDAPGDVSTPCADASVDIVRITIARAALTFPGPVMCGFSPRTNHTFAAGGFAPSSSTKVVAMHSMSIVEFGSGLSLPRIVILPTLMIRGNLLTR